MAGGALDVPITDSRDRLAEVALAEMTRAGETPVGLDEARRELGL
jgi:hypothetical protein